jgi:hypothetical protein
VVARRHQGWSPPSRSIDQLVGQILAASVNPQEVLDAGNWLLDNPNEGQRPGAAAGRPVWTGDGALVQFPDVVDMMCQSSTGRNSSARPSLRTRRPCSMPSSACGRAPSAWASQVHEAATVEKTTQEGQPVVIVKPADPKVIYVPQYDPQVVYTQAAPAGASREQ